MKIKLLLITLLGLGLSACKKEDNQNNNEHELLKLETIEIYGLKYCKDSVTNEMSAATGFPSDKIFFEEKQQKFKVEGLYFDFNPEDYLILKNK